MQIVYQTFPTISLNKACQRHPNHGVLPRAARTISHVCKSELETPPSHVASLTKRASHLGNTTFRSSLTSMCPIDTKTSPCTVKTPQRLSKHTLPIKSCYTFWLHTGASPCVTFIASLSNCLMVWRLPDNDHSSNQLSVHKALTCPEGQSAWALVCRPRATWNEVGLYLRWKRGCGSLALMSVAGPRLVVFVGLLFVVALVFMRSEDRHIRLCKPLRAHVGCHQQFSSSDKTSTCPGYIKVLAPRRSPSVPPSTSESHAATWCSHRSGLHDHVAKSATPFLPKLPYTPSHHDPTSRGTLHLHLLFAVADLSSCLQRLPSLSFYSSSDAQKRCP